MFDVQDDRLANWHLADLEVESVPFEQHTAKFDLHLSCQETADGLVGTVNYRTDLFTSQTISRLAGGFVQLLDSLAAAPDQPLAQVERPVTGRTQPAYQGLAHPPLTVPPPAADEGALLTLLRLSWCRLLPVPTIGPDDDFFELGGNSLLAFQLTTDLHRQVGYPISVGSIFANPTLRQLAAFLQTHHPNCAWPSLVPIRSQGTELPLFLVHPVSGDIAYVYRLASHLPANQPVYGLRAVGLDGLSRPHDTIEAMAAHYVQLIVGQQPDGPYAVGGFSLGGVIAYEMARQLRTLGKTVRLVALIDCYPMTPDPDEPDQLPVGQLLRYYRYYWRSLPFRPRLLWHVVQRKAPVAGKILLRKLMQKAFGNPHQAANQPPTAHLSARQLELEASSKQAYSRYVFRPFDGKVVLLRSVGNEALADPDLDGPASTFGWDRYAQGGVRVYLLSGTHQSLFQSEAVIARIAGILTASLTG